VNKTIVESDYWKVSW